MNTFTNKNNTLKQLPSVDEVLKNPDIQGLLKQWERPFVVHVIRQVLDDARLLLKNGGPFHLNTLTEQVPKKAASILGSALKPVINATGILLHTNLGRAPLGHAVANTLMPSLNGYSSLEFDLSTGKRGSRSVHCVGLLRYLTGAESAVVVNNNAAAIVLVLTALAKRCEVIVSRGELVEIGGSFRIPDIMAASGAKMVEVGTTNKTRLSDYEKALSPKTALIFKAHRSNFSIKGFTDEVSIEALAGLARKKKIPFVYDIGSGLVRPHKAFKHTQEPTVSQSIKSGADLVLFSGDKLLGGPQAGMIAGRADLVATCARHPLMRALRVDKMTIAALTVVLRAYVSADKSTSIIPLYEMLGRTSQVLDAMAHRLCSALHEHNIQADCISTFGQYGGGTLPNAEIQSRAVVLGNCAANRKASAKSAEKLFTRLLEGDKPILGILREGQLYFDMLALSEHDVDICIERLCESIPTL